MNRNFRLTRTSDFKRVRRFGKSYSHPLVVLVTFEDAENSVRIGVLAGRAIGSAVYRNRAKRLLREAVRPLVPRIKPGYKLILIARPPIRQARLQEIEVSLQQLFSKAKIIDNI